LRLVETGLYCGDMGPRRKFPAGFVEPCIPTLSARPPSSADWVHEIKHEGYRLIVHRDGDTVRLFTRRGHDWTGRYPAIARAAADVVDTDHVGYTREDKLDPSLDIIDHRPAGNYLQVQLPLLYSEGVRTGRITLERMVALSSTNPAKLFGLYPRKGTIAVGSDADVVIWDPNLKRTVRNEDQLANAKFSIFEGWELTGWPIVTIRRGEVVYEGGKVLAAAGSGQLATRQHWQRR
jgi:hypothetical protein